MSGNVADARLFDHDDLTGITEYFYYDPDTDGFRIEAQQDVESIIEVNKALYNDAPTTPHGKFGDGMHRVASIPLVVYQDLIAQGVIEPHGHVRDQERFRRWLNDRDNQVFRVAPGKV